MVWLKITTIIRKKFVLIIYYKARGDKTSHHVSREIILQSRVTWNWAITCYVELGNHVLRGIGQSRVMGNKNDQSRVTENSLYGPHS